MSTQLFGPTEHTDNKIVPIRSARLDQIELPNTLIAGRLFDHFSSGGSIADAVRLVESLEQSPTAGARAVVPASAKSRPKELPPDWAPSALDLTFARGSNGKIAASVSVGTDMGDYTAKFSAVTMAADKLAGAYDYPPDAQGEVTIAGSFDAKNATGTWSLGVKGQPGGQAIAGTWKVSKQ